MTSIEFLNELSRRWTEVMISGLLGTFLVAVIVSGLWLVLRKKAPASLGYWLFFLIVLKLFIPVEVPLPKIVIAHLPKWSVEQHDTVATEIFAEEPTAQPPVIDAVEYDTTTNEKAQSSYSPPTVLPQPLDFSISEAPEKPDLKLPESPPFYEPEISTVSGVFEIPAASKPQWSPMVIPAILWCVIVFVLVVRFLVNEIRFRHTLSLSNEIDLSIQELADAMRIRKRISVRESDRIAIPAVSGIFRPTILLPKHFVQTLPQDELRWILLHELAHVKRFDLPLAFVLRMASILHFFNPAIWYAASQIRKLREYACDDLALATLKCDNVQKTGGSALIHVVEHARNVHTPVNEALGAFDFKSSLKKRLRRLLDTRRTIRTKLGVGSMVLLLLVAAVALPKLTAQHDPPAKTEIQAVTPQSKEKEEFPDDFMTEVTGRIVDESGQPLPYVWIYLIESQDNRNKLRRFLFSDSNQNNLSENALKLDETTLKNYRLIAISGGDNQFTGNDGTFKMRTFKDDEVSIIIKGRNRTKTLKTTKRGDLGDIVLTPGIEPTVRILTPDGQPFPAGWCNFYPADKDQRGGYLLGESKIFLTGRCDFESFEPGQYTISISKCYGRKSNPPNIDRSGTMSMFNILYAFQEKTVTLSPQSKDFTIKALDTVTVTLRFQDDKNRNSRKWYTETPVFFAVADDNPDSLWSCTWSQGDAMGDGVYRFHVPKNVPLRFSLPQNEGSLYRLQLPGEQTSHILSDLNGYMMTPINLEIRRMALDRMNVIPPLQDDCEFQIIPVKPASVSVRAVDENGQTISDFRVLPRYHQEELPESLQKESDSFFVQKEREYLKTPLSERARNFPVIHGPYGMRASRQENEVILSAIYPEEDLRLMVGDAQGRRAFVDLKLKEDEEKQITVTLKKDNDKNNVTVSPENFAPPVVPGVPPEVTVTITDENLKPMKDVLLKVRLAKDRKEFRSDENGKVVVDTKPYQNVESGWFTFEAVAANRVTTSWAWLRNKETPTAIPSQFTIRLEPGYTIGGTVVDEQRKAVAGAKVVPSYDHRNMRGGNMYADEQLPLANWDGVITDAQGQWKAEGYSGNNGQIMLRVTHDDFLPLVKDDETSGYLMSDILSGKAKTVLKSGFHIHGTVRGPQGEPISGAVITFDHPHTGNHPSAQRKTDENGRYNIKSWYKKSTKYSVVAPNLAPDFGTLDFDAPKYAQQKEAEFDFTLKKGKTVRLKVVDPEGNQIKKFWVCLHFGQPFMEDAFSPYPNNEGIWEWHNAPDEELSFDVDSMKGFDRINDIKMKPREEPFVATARGTTVVSGNVIDSETKKPIENFNLIQGMIRIKPLPGYSDEFWGREGAINMTGGFYTLSFDSSPEPEDSRVRFNAIRIEAVGYEPEQSKAIDLDGKKQMLNFELKPSKTKPVRAVVLLPDGKPAANAEVALGGVSSIAVRTRNDQIAGNTGNTVIKADEKGAFEFPTPGVPYVILAAHPDGFAFARQAEVETGTIRMIPWARIEGTVYKNDKPAPKAAIWGDFMMPDEQQRSFPRSQCYEAQVEATADAEGKFVIERVAPGLNGFMGFKDESAYIRVTTESVKTATVEIVPESVEDDAAKNAGPTLGEKIPEVLVPQDVTIHVMDEQGKAIVGAKIGFRHAEDGYGRKQVTTDESGTAVYKDMTGKANIISAGLEVYADGYATGYRNWERSDGRFDTVPAELKIVLKKGVRIGGKVVDEKGEPIEGARIDINYPSPQRSNYMERAGRPTTDAEGRWSIDTFPPGTTDFRLKVTHPKFQSTDQTTILPTFDQLKAENSVITLKTGMIVEGVVKKEDGSPLEEATVVLWRFPFTGEYRVVKTDKNGKYSLDNWQKTGTFIAAIAVGLAPDSKLMSEKEFQTPIDFTLKPGKTVRLKFVDKKGDPVSGVSVTPFRWRGQSAVLSGSWQTVPGKSDAQGDYLWNWAPEDEIQYTFSKTGYLAVRDKAIKPGDEVQTITMVRPLMINGTVIDAETRKPISEFNVIPGINWGVPYMSGGQIGWEKEKSQPFRDGKFKIVFDEPRDGHHVRVEADGYVPFSSEMYKDDQGEVNLTVELRKGENLQGRVLRSDGVTPAAGIEVLLGTKGGNPPSFTNGNLNEASRKQYKILRTDEDGYFTVPPLSEPFMLLPFSDVGLAKISGKEFQDKPDARTVTLIPWGRVEGKLMIPPIAKTVGFGPEIRSVSTSMTQKMLQWNHDTEGEPDPWYSHTAQPDTEGNFVIPKVLPAKMNFAYQTYRNLDGGGLIQTDFVRTSMIEIEPGKTVQIQFGEQPCTPVEGKIVLSEADAKRTDWKGATIRLWPNIGPEVLSPDIWSKVPDEEREKFFDKTEEDGKPSWKLKEGEENLKALQDYYKNWLETDGKEANQAYTKYQEKLKATDNRIYQAIPDENGKFRFGGVAPGKYWYSVRFDCPAKTRQESFNRKVLASPDAEITIDPGSETVDLDELNVELQELNRTEQYRWSEKR